MRRRSAGVTASEGASSISFWCRRWMLHSRSPSATTRPYESASTWISTCRGRSRYFSRYSSPAPNAFWASLWAVWNADSTSPSSRTRRMPFPPPRFGLVAHRADRRGRRAHEHQPRTRHRLRERRALGEEAVAGVDRLAAGPLRRANQLRDVEVRLRRGGGADRHRDVGGAHVRRQPVRVGIDGDHLDPFFVAGPDDTKRDFAAVRDEEAFDGSHDASVVSHQWLTSQLTTDD